MINWTTITQQLRTVAAQEGEGWPAVQAALHPELLRLARQQRIGRLRDDRDAAHDIATRVLERIHAHEFRALKRLFDTEHEPVVQAWIRVLVRTAAIDTMRQHAEYRRGADPGWVSLATLASSPNAPPPSSLTEKQRDLARFLERALAEYAAAVTEHGANAVAILAARWAVDPVQVRRVGSKGERYLPVLRLVLLGYSYPEVGAQLDLTRREVELVVQYIEEMLSARRFAA